MYVLQICSTSSSQCWRRRFNRSAIRSRVELRQRNMLGPDDLPFVTRTQMPYDNGDYPKVLTRAANLGRNHSQASTGRSAGASGSPR